MNILNMNDPILKKLIKELIDKHQCHTILLYGSRARGDTTPHSDYDLMGVRKTGKKYRVARKQFGVFIDIFIFPEKDLKKVDETHIYMNGAKVIYEQSKFGSNFVKRLKLAVKRKFKPLPADEIEMIRVWLHKMLERAKVGDIEGNYRRSWLHAALLSDYFGIRKKRYWGSKQSFQWLKENDKITFRLFDKVLKNPSNLSMLKKLVERVSERKPTK